ncbi:hypothetical protein QWY31_08355 [Cytophagales bacterium LB-30]|uniref:Aspartyl protease n=1 Tax=Shiella aurantiaca TaxID=3058365 RepID=A0ABT8F5G4_9BACT|nr:hypothetical protein [Shiella aurantiaca]MDN4165509.1 hypothetical protein [Shiella aurantiaca]
MKKLFNLSTLALLFSCSADEPTGGANYTLPGEMIAHQFYVYVATPTGDSLRFFTDTGGGVFLMPQAAKDLNLTLTEEDMDGQKGNLAQFADLCADASFPVVSMRGRQIIPVMSEEVIAKKNMFDASVDGMLGQAWFANHTWRMDYKSGQLTVNVPAVEEEGEHIAPLGFFENKLGMRQMNFPRIQMEVEGEALDVLFDTGASLFPSTEAGKAMGDTVHTQIGTSFIIDSVLNRWAEQHPDWRIIINSDAKMGGNDYVVRSIEVPSIKVAGHEVGPVWFTSRPNENFTGYMSQWMDQTVYGALGGSAFQYFTITVDYPNARAKFEKN